MKIIPLRADVLHLRLITHCIAAFVVVTVTGVWLRTYPLLAEQPFVYKNLLHAHSHFAFAGWLTPALGWALLVSTPELHSLKNVSHMKRAIYVMLVSAYGMLLSFPFQGYGAVSIIFSSLSVIATYYLAFVIYKALRQSNSLYSKLIKMAVCFLAFSSIGAIATGPLAAMGFKDSPVYFDAVYTYLHFYMNGWFCLAAIALLARHFVCTPVRRQRLITWLYFTGIMLTLPLSYLWHQPGIYLNVTGALGAGLQLWATVLLLLQLQVAGSKAVLLNFSGRLVAGFILLKSILQLISALQPVTDYLMLHRPLTVAYLHLNTLGIATLSIFSLLLQRFYTHKPVRFAVTVFLAAFIATELLLLLQGMAVVINTRHIPLLLASISCLFMASSFSLFMQMLVYSKSRRKTPDARIDGNFNVILNG